MSASHDEEVIYEGEPHSPEDVMFWDCENVLRAGIWLVRNGYGKLALLPYLSPSGCYWRCEFHPIGQPRKTLYRYSTGSAGKYLQDHHGGRVRRSISPKGLALAIMRSVPDESKALCAGDVSPETESWLEQVERALSLQWIPQAFHEYTDDFSRWDLVSLHGAPSSSIDPQPGYVAPGTEGTESSALHPRPDTAGMARLVAALLASHGRQPRQTPESVKSLDGYAELVDGAAGCGFTGPGIDLDERFAERSAEWLQTAEMGGLQRWVHSILRAERWNSEWPTAILDALQDGRLQALADRLRAASHR
ncbi:MAG TPA: hypothetical protein VLC92_09620 [Rhodocyclaceae bacterium]|nr:hypothetical protein [Rhodocyclaceae bacterium]